MRRQLAIRILGAAAVAALATAGAQAYSTYAKWGYSPVTVLVNPTNVDVTAAAAEAALQAGMDVWNIQSGSSFRFQYGGRVADTSTSNDGRNVVIFRNASNGSTIATTYSWWNGSNLLVDSDIIFWDGGFKFYTGATGCGGVSNSAYIEDVAAHELGHAMGLSHSNYTDATMYPSYGYCSQAFRTLAPDDIAGAKYLYPAAGITNTAPTVSIASPANGASFAEGTSITFSGSALDTQDGNLTASIQWTDNGSAIGQGGSFSRILTVGSHTIVARVTDLGGLAGSRQVGITVTSTAPAAGPTLTTRGRKVKGLQKVDLYWNGLSASSLDVYRNSVKVTSTANDGSETDPVNKKGPATYTYKVCELGTATCSNNSTVVF